MLLLRDSIFVSPGSFMSKPSLVMISTVFILHLAERYVHGKLSLALTENFLQIQHSFETYLFIFM